MKKLWFSVICTCLLALSPGLAEPPEALSSDIRAVMSKPLYQNARWGLRVVDVETGEVLLDQGKDQSFYIGSVRKVFSVGLLLNQVGPDHTYDTPVYSQGTVENGTLDGALVLVASGDLPMGGRTNPDGTLAITNFDHNEANSLGSSQLTETDPLAGYRKLARQVAEAGITRIVGDVAIDDRLFQPFNFRDEFDVRPIFVNDDVVDLSMTPAAVDQPVKVEVRPISSALKVEANVTTGAAGSETNLEIEPEFPADIGTPGASVQVSGSLPADLVPPFVGELPLVRTIRITNPTNYARTVFVEALEAEGVTVDAAAVKPNPVAVLPKRNSYQAKDRVALLTGSPYGEVGKWILKVSYNIGADTSLLLLGVAQGVDNLTDALEVEKKVLVSDYGLQPSDFHFIDGSGGGETTATNSAVTTVLIKLKNSPQGEVFFQALPVLAVDGSLGFVTDFTTDDTLAGAAGKVRAKTGTYAAMGPNGLLLKGQGFGGFIESKSGRLLAYHLTVNEVQLPSLQDMAQVFQDEGTISAILWRDF